MPAPPKQLQQPSGEAHIYVHNRPFTSFCNNKRLPKAVIHAAVEAGVCHYQIYVSLPEGKILTYDFGPVGGRDTTLRSDNKRGTPAEIREHLVDAVPAGALRVASVRNMTHEAIRAYNAQQPTYYKLHKSDCRHYCNKFVSHFAGKRTNATVQLLRAQYQARVLKERAQLLQLLQQNGSHLPPLDLGPLLKRGQRITGTQQQQAQQQAQLSAPAGAPHALLEEPAQARAQLSSSSSHASAGAAAGTALLAAPHHHHPPSSATGSQHSAAAPTGAIPMPSSLPNHSPSHTLHPATSLHAHPSHAHTHMLPHSGLPPHPNPLTTDTRFQLFSWHTLAQLATGSAQPFLVPNLTPLPPSPSPTDPHMTLPGLHQNARGLPHLTLSSGYEWYQSTGVAGYNPHSPSGAATLLLPLLSRLPPWHAPVFSTLQWLTDCENWEQLEQLQKVGATAATAFGGVRAWAFVPHMHSLLRLPLDFSMARLPAALAAAASLAKLPRFAGLARLPTAGSSFVRLPRVARRAVAGRAASLRGIKGAPSRGSSHAHNSSSASVNEKGVASGAANSGSSNSGGPMNSSSGGDGAASVGSWMQQHSSSSSSSSGQGMQGPGMQGPGSWGATTGSTVGQGAASAAPASSLGSAPAFAPTPSMAAQHTHSAISTPSRTRPAVSGLIWHPARRLARSGSRALWAVRARARARAQPHGSQRTRLAERVPPQLRQPQGGTHRLSSARSASSAPAPAAARGQEQQPQQLRTTSVLAGGLPLPLPSFTPSAGAAAAGAAANAGATGAATATLGAAGAAGAASAASAAGAAGAPAGAAAAALAAALTAVAVTAPQLQQQQQQRQQRHEDAAAQEPGARTASSRNKQQQEQLPSTIIVSEAALSSASKGNSSHPSPPHDSSTSSTSTTSTTISSGGGSSSSSSSSVQRLPLQAQVGMLMGGLALLNRHCSGLGELAHHFVWQRQQPQLQPQLQQTHPQAQQQQQQQQLQQQQVEREVQGEVNDESGACARARQQRVAFLPRRTPRAADSNSSSSSSSSGSSSSGSSNVRGWVWNGGEGAHTKEGMTTGLLHTTAVGQPQLMGRGVDSSRSKSSSGSGGGMVSGDAGTAQGMGMRGKEARDGDGPPAAARLGVGLLPLQLHPHQSHHPLTALARAVGAAARKHAMRSLL